MAFNKTIPMILTLLLCLAPLSAWEEVMILQDVVQDINGLVRWELQESDIQRRILVQRFQEGKELWSCAIESTGIDTQIDREVPLEAYILTADVITFPLTIIEEDGRVIRRQIAIDMHQGTLLWDKRITAGLSQRYFYAITDGNRLLLHNLHEIQGPELLCLDLKNGEEIWQTSGPVQPALPLQTEDYFILHNSRLNRVYIIDKENGNLQEEKTLFPVRIWNQQILLFSQQPNGLDLSIWNPLQKEFMGAIPQGFPVFIYKDSLILQEELETGRYRLCAYSLKDKGARIWSASFPGSYPIDEWRMGWGSSNINYLYDGSILFNKPDKTLFYPSSGKIAPFLVHTEENNFLKFYMVNLETGRITFSPKEAHYSFQYTLMQDTQWYYLFFTGLEQEMTLLLRLNKETGEMESGLLFPEDNFDQDQAQQSPFYCILQEATDRLKFAEEGPWRNYLEEQLMGE